MATSGKNSFVSPLGFVPASPLRKVWVVALLLIQVTSVGPKTVSVGGSKPLSVICIKFVPVWPKAAKALDACWADPGKAGKAANASAAGVLVGRGVGVAVGVEGCAL